MNGVDELRRAFMVAAPQVSEEHRAVFAEIAGSRINSLTEEVSELKRVQKALLDALEDR